MKRLLVATGLAVFLLSACGGTDRPEGVVERWLISLNQGKAGEPEKYASAVLSDQILPHWEDRDPGDLDVIEVGRGRATDQNGIVLGDYEVPFRVERRSGVKLDGVAFLVHREGEWRVIETNLEDRSLLVPSEGGDSIGNASAGAWLLAVGISAGLMLLVAVIMALTPEPAPLPVRPRNT